MRQRLLRDLNISITSYVKNLYYEVWQSVKSYLVKIHIGQLKTDTLELEDLFSVSPDSGVVTSPAISGLSSNEDFIISQPNLVAIIRFGDHKYYVSCNKIEYPRSSIYILSVTGTDPENINSAELADILIKEAIATSGYSKKILRIFYDEMSDRISLKILPPYRVKLKDIFIKEKDELRDFIEVVKKGGSSIKYLFVGEPGTGKTETIKALLSECMEANSNLTSIVVDASCRVSLTTVIEYAQIFKPVLVCIDDIDLLVGSRDRFPHPSHLASTLQILDGFLSTDEFYLIATTNDRALLDWAVRRPGRFDYIMEFGPLDPQFYPDLVLRETRDEKFAEIFKDPEVVKKLSSLKINGAFLVTLVRYLQRPRFSETKYSKKEVLEVLNRLFRAFKSELRSEESVGFKLV
ncbi:MAG: cell division protease FtsH [Thermoanaerobacterium sp.]|jgi:DNA polymerase III delta prime subunit|nr:AAA family ATPase [Candidatus Aerophobetes bacterium]MBC7332705.1 AAA family ATPase [Synergistota bacterium]MDI3476715.1 cell division protease FtsH [Thermoanaerobacterium sp.]HCP09291.1 AAA family ATPase [Thermodesulfobacterium commune]